MSQIRTEIVPCEGSNAGQGSAGRDAVGTAAGFTVQVKPELGQPTATGHDVAGEHQEGSPSRDSKVQLAAEDCKSAAEPTAAERDAAGEYEEGRDGHLLLLPRGGMSPSRDISKIGLKSVAAT